MTFSVEGKSVLVTGANRGIGKGFVKVLLAEGAEKIYAAARDLGNLKEVIALNPEVILPVQLDVTKIEQVKALAKSIDSLDILVNNAGIATGVYTTGLNAVDIARQEMEVNLFGPMAITQVLLPRLRASNEAAIINISSIAGISNFPSLGPYSTTKAALHSFTQGLRADLRDSNIQVLGVYPGPTDTRLAEGVDMPKPSPDQVAVATLDSLSKGVNDVFPDEFSNHMYSTFLAHPQKLEEAFAEMTSI